MGRCSARTRPPGCCSWAVHKLRSSALLVVVPGEVVYMDSDLDKMAAAVVYC